MMKRAKLAAIVVLGLFALASCDAMLEALFPEFASDADGNFGNKTIEVTVTIDSFGLGYRANGNGTASDIRVVAVQWTFNQFGHPVFIRDGNGLDLQNQYVQPDDRAGDIPQNSMPGAQDTFTIQVPDGNWGVIVFEDENGDGFPSTAESARIAYWVPPPEFMHGEPEQFDFFFLNGHDKTRTSIVADPPVLLLHGGNVGGEYFGDLPY
jgi:hypothetical protein